MNARSDDLSRLQEIYDVIVQTMLPAAAFGDGAAKHTFIGTFSYKPHIFIGTFGRKSHASISSRVFSFCRASRTMSNGLSYDNSCGNVVVPSCERLRDA